MLKVTEKSVENAISIAQENFKKQLILTEKKGYSTDTYCCGKCTIAYWRTLMTGWLPGWEEKISRGIADLTRCRLNGKWRRYPFYYTLQCLHEMPIDLAKREIGYIRKECDRAIGHLQLSNPYYSQRKKILTNILEAA